MILVALVFAGGMSAGIATGPDAKTEYKVIHVKDEVVKTETVEVVSLPDGCTDAIEYANEMNAAAQKLGSGTAEVLDVMSRLRIAVAMSDSNATNTLETELRKIDGRTIGASETLGEVQPDYDVAVIACLGE